MAVFAKVTVFYVEQGLGQLIEVMDSTGGCQFLALVDLGTQRVKIKLYSALANRTNAMGKSLDTIRTAVSNHNNTLDLVVISHTDFDHISLMVRLFGELKPTVGKVFLGGTPYRRNSVSSLISGKIEKETPSAPLKELGKMLKKMTPAPKDQMAYFATQNHYFTKHGNTYTAKQEHLAALSYGQAGAKNPRILLRVVTSRNFLSAVDIKKDGGNYINYNSVVLALEIYEDQNDAVPKSVILLTGDIQWTSMEYLNRVFTAAGTACFPFLTNGVHRIMVAPHHGALKSACTGNKLEKNGNLVDQMQDMAAFGRHIDCEILIASAKYGTYPHPCEQVLAEWGNTASASPSHRNMVKHASYNSAGKCFSFTNRIQADEQKSVYTTYEGKVGGTETGRDVVLTIDTTGTVTAAVVEKGDA